MAMDSSSMEHSPGSNSVIYSNVGTGSDGAGSNGANGSYQGVGYGGNGGYVIPLGTVIASDSNHNQCNGFGENEVKALGYENMYGSADPYHSRNLYYLSQQSSTGGVKVSSYDQASASNNWVPTAVPTIAQRSSNMAACQGTPTFAVWNDT